METKSKVNNIDIVNGKREDAVRVRQLHAEIWKATYPNEEQGISQEWVEERTAGWFTEESLNQTVDLYDEIEKDPSQFLKVAYKSESPIGFIHGLKKDRYIEVAGLYIHPDFHGTGLAHQLMNELLTWAGSDRDLKLEVVTYNKRAQEFYKKYNFKIVEDSKKPFKDSPMEVFEMIRKGQNNEV